MQIKISWDSNKLVCMIGTDDPAKERITLKETPYPIQLVLSLWTLKNVDVDIVDAWRGC